MASACSQLRMRRSLLAVAVILAWMLVLGDLDAANARADPTLVTTVPSMGLDPRTNGKVIVYNTRPGSYDIFAISLRGATPFPIATGQGDQVLEGISGDWVLWYESSNAAPFGTVRATNLVTHRVVVISGKQGAVSAALSGNSVVWMSYTGRG